MFYKKVFYFLLFLVSIQILNCAHAQSSADIQQNLIWQKKSSPYQYYTSILSQYVQFDKCTFKYDEKYLLPCFYYKIPLASNLEAIATINNYSFESGMPTGLYAKSKLLNNAITLQQNISWENNKKYLVIEFIPIILQNGTAQYINNFNIHLQYNVVAVPILTQNKSITHSVLSTGTWYKIAVNNTGIYKIDASFLQNTLGINLSNITKSNIRIFSAGDGPIEEKITANFKTDLQEIPISVSNESSNSFGAQDYILFYGYSSDKVNLNKTSNQYYVTKNNYDLFNYYFLTIDNGTGLRFNTASNLAASATDITEFNDFQYINNDTKNIGLTGRIWFDDEDFEYDPSRNYTFSTPDVVPNSLSLSYATAAAAPVVTDMNVFANGTLIRNFQYSIIIPDYENPVASNNAAISTLPSYNSSSLVINMQYNKPSSSSGNAWLDYIYVNYKRYLKYSGGQLSFRNNSNLVSGGTANFKISTTNPNITVWNLNAKTIMPLHTWSSGVYFTANIDTIQEYVITDGTAFNSPINGSKIANQDLHALQSMHPNCVIVTHPDFYSAAVDLGNFHTTLNQRVAVVKTTDVYNEFGGGKKEATAIRNFVKLLYDAAQGDSVLMPRWLVLMGDGSYDNKNLHTTDSYIPTYQSLASTDPVPSYSSDDFYGLMSLGEGENIETNNQLIDVSVGRLPVRTQAEANDVVAKIKLYQSNQSFGNWRNMLTFVADDEDGDTHINQSDYHAKIIATKYPEYNIDKIYLDAYQQQELPSGSRYPTVNDAIIRRIENGTLLMNYTGHGGEIGWAHERVFQIEDMDALTNSPKFPLFITATCQFSRFDNHDIYTAGERLILNPKGGAIGLYTTVRLVFSGGNQDLNDNIFKYFFAKRTNSTDNFCMGEILQRAKNNSSGDANNRKFTLLGDPGITLALPKYKVKNITFNGHAISNADTIKALDKITITGQVTDLQGQLLNNFNGVAYPTLFDKSTKLNTLSNDANSPVTSFDLQKNTIFKGKASVKNGLFSYTFIVPKDISFQYGNGKFSYYANNEAYDASGFDGSVIVGGASNRKIIDTKGPEIQIYMNDYKFVNGGTTNTDPVLLVKLFDINGLNTVGNAIGHEITATIDNNPQSTISLNDFYEGVLDDYQAGLIKFPYNNLKPGKHTLQVKAWDVLNNSSTKEIEFTVVENTEMAITHVYNYPNPFTTKTVFMFEHNMPNELLTINIKIYSVSGKVIKNINQTIITEGYRSNDITWDGKDEYGNLLGRGVYIYKISASNAKGTKNSKFEKLVIL